MSHKGITALFSLAILVSSLAPVNTLRAEPPVPEADTEPKQTSLCRGSFTWFPSASDSVCAVSLVLHGLNNRADVMDPLISLLNAEGFHALRLELTGHGKDDSCRHLLTENDWSRDIETALAEIRLRYPSLPTVALAFSLGGAAVIRFVDTHPDANVSAMALLAPAVSLDWKASLLRLLAHLSFLPISLPSLSPERYRRSATTSLSAYQALFRIVDNIEQLENPQRIGAIPTEVFICRDDELIDSADLRQWMKDNALSAWRLSYLRPSSSISHPYGHIILDEFSLGTMEWQRLTRAISSHLLSVCESRIRGKK